MRTIIRCLLGPRLYRIYSNPGVEGHQYSPTAVERYSDWVLRSMNLLWSFSVYTCPVLISMFYRRGYFSYDGLFVTWKLLTTIGFIFLLSLGVRGIGRYSNIEYITFLTLLYSAKENYNKESQKSLRQYDFDFKYWPVDFKPRESNEQKGKQGRKRKPFRLAALPCEILAYIMANTIGRRMLYPGSVGLLQSAMGPMIDLGRTRLIQELGGRRNKIQTEDGNSIDTIFIDKRLHSTKGEILVVCCEGNAGFYEVGIVPTPVEAGYSVLGWNHPGFGGSTGIPFPETEINAIDAVMQFAIYKLGFPLENIALFAWSIGGYTASWAAMAYPDIRALILDATFDDLLPLALAKMPASWEPLVVSTVKRYLNLNIRSQLLKFNGPLLIYRRLKDEVITTDEAQSLGSNRGNFLLCKVLQYRFPKIFDSKIQEVLEQWLVADKRERALMTTEYQIDEDFCRSVILSCIGDDKLAFPLHVGDGLNENTKIQMALYLVSKYLHDFNSTHCTPLPVGMFQMPWNPIIQRDQPT